MASPITLILPTPPSVNAAYRNVVGRGRVRTDVYLEWLAEADAFLLQQKRGLNGKVPVEGRRALEIRIPEKTPGDASNRIKACEDFLVSRGITGDDKHNWKVSIERADINECLVTITPISE